jgi:hypothetical protein
VTQVPFSDMSTLICETLHISRAREKVEITHSIHSVLVVRVNHVPRALYSLADHFETAARVYASGAGRRIHLSVLTKGDSHTVSKAITSILEQGNPYQTAAERVAGMMKAYGGVKTDANVVGFVAAYGYDHLKIARWEMGWLAQHSVDVLAFWLAVLGGFLVLGVSVVRRLLRVVTSGGKQKAA